GATQAQLAALKTAMTEIGRGLEECDDKALRDNVVFPFTFTLQPDTEGDHPKKYTYKDAAAVAAQCKKMKRGILALPNKSALKNLRVRIEGPGKLTLFDSDTLVSWHVELAGARWKLTRVD